MAAVSTSATAPGGASCDGGWGRVVLGGDCELRGGWGAVKGEELWGAVKGGEL